LPFTLGQIAQLGQMSLDKTRTAGFVQCAACNPVGAPPVVSSARILRFHSSARLLIGLW
jgi:hypothetical protein